MADERREVRLGVAPDGGHGKWGTRRDRTDGRRPGSGRWADPTSDGGIDPGRGGHLRLVDAVGVQGRGEPDPRVANGEGPGLGPEPVRKCVWRRLPAAGAPSCSGW